MLETVGLLALLEKLGMVIGALTAIFGFLWGGWKAIRYVGRWHARKLQRDKEDRDMHTKVSEIYDQLKSVDGSSLRGTVEIMNQRMLRLEEQAGVAAQISNLILLDAGLAIFHADKEGNFTSVNRTFQIIAGRSEIELNDLGWTSSIDYEQRGEILEEWLESVKYEREFHAEFNVVHTDGTKHPVSCKAFPLRNKEGNVTGWMGFVRRMDTTTSPAVYRR